jgi:hypothetical protein
MNRRKLIKSAVGLTSLGVIGGCCELNAGLGYLQNTGPEDLGSKFQKISVDKFENPESWSQIKEVYYMNNGTKYNIKIGDSVCSISEVTNFVISNIDINENMLYGCSYPYDLRIVFKDKSYENDIRSCRVNLK